MGLLFDSGLSSLLASYRLCWISGRFGGGKTSLAYYLAKEYLQRGYRLVSNNRSVWSDELENVKLCEEHHQLHAVVILDEGGLEFKSSKQIETIAAYARKMDVIYIIPSFWPPVRSAQVLTVQPLFNFKQAGIPLIIYRWRVKIGGMDDKGYFGWWNPREIYGVYSSQDPGDKAKEIVEWAIQRTKEYRVSWGRDDNLSEVEIGEFDQFSDAVNQLSDVADDLSSLRVRKRKR